MDLRVEKRKLRDKYGDIENLTPAHVAVIITPYKINPLDPKMTPPQAHTTRGLFDGSGSVNAAKSQDGNKTVTSSNGQATSAQPVSSIQPVTSDQPVTGAQPDDIERRDFEEENSLPGCSKDDNNSEDKKTVACGLLPSDYPKLLKQFSTEQRWDNMGDKVDTSGIEALLRKSIEGWRVLTEQAIQRRQRYIEERKKEMEEDERRQRYLQQKRREQEAIERRQRFIKEETQKEEEAILRRQRYNQQKQREQEVIERRRYVEQEAMERRQRYIEHKQKEQEGIERRRYIENTQRAYQDKIIMHHRNMGARRQDVFNNIIYERLRHDQELEQRSDNYQCTNNYQRSNNYQSLNNYQNLNNYRNLNDYPISNNNQSLNNYQRSNNYQNSNNYPSSDNYQNSDMNVNDDREIIGIPVPLQEEMEDTTEEDRGYHYQDIITMPYHHEIEDSTGNNYEGDEDNYVTEFNDFEPMPIQVEIEEPVELSDQNSDNNDAMFMSHPIGVEIEVPSDRNSENNDIITMPMSSSINDDIEGPADHNSDNNDIILPMSSSIKVEVEDPIDQDSNSNLEQKFGDYNDITMSHSVKEELDYSTIKEEIDYSTDQTSGGHKKNLSKYENVIMPRPIGEKRKKPVDKKMNGKVNENNGKNENVIMPRPIGEKRKNSTNQSLNNRIDENNSAKSKSDVIMPPIKQEVEDLGDDVLNSEESNFATNTEDNIKVEKEDFMQKLLNSNTSEKKVFPKGKLYRAEAMEGVDIDMSDAHDTTGPSGSDNSNALSIESTSSNVLNIGSTSSNVLNIGSTSSGSTPNVSTSTTLNADRLLGLDKKSKLSELTRSKTKTYGICLEDEAGEEHNDDSWCACLSSHEDDDDDDDEQEPEPEPDRQLRKRRNEPPAPQAAKKFCPEDSHVGSSAAEPRPVPCSSGVQPSTSQDPPELNQWLNRFATWSNSEKTQAIDALINRCAAGEVRHMMTAIEPLFQRDFISLLPKELALSVLGYLEPRDLLRAAQTCRYWRFLADDNLLWKEKCRRIGITTLKKIPRTLPRCASLWKAAYMRQHMIEHNWLHKSVKDPIVMRGHDDHVITCLQFSRNRILSGSDDTTLRVWSAVTGKCLRILVGHSGGVWSSQMVGHLVISGSTDRTLRVWNAKSGHCIKVLAGHTSTVRCMHLHDNRVVSGSRDATLRVWSLPDGRCLRVLVGHIAAVRCVQFDGKYVVSGAYDYFVKVWNPDSGECLHTLSGHTNRVYSLQFDGVHVVSGSLDTSIRVWEVKTGQLKHTLTGHQSLTSGMELNSNILVSGNADSTVKVWNIATGHCLHTLAGPNKHQSAVTCLQSSNRFVITSSDDGTVKLWDVRTGEFIRNLVELGSGGSGGVVWRIRASGTKLVCAVGSRNGTEETKLLVLNFDIPGACRRCNE